MNYYYLYTIPAIPMFATIILIEFLCISSYHRILKSDYYRFSWIALAVLVIFNFLWIYLAILLFSIQSFWFIVVLAALSVSFHWIQTRYAALLRSFYIDIFLFGLWLQSLIINIELFSRQSYGFLKEGTVYLHVILLPVGVALSLFLRYGSGKQKISPQAKSVRLSIITVILLSYFIPFVSYHVNRAYCSWQNMRLAEPIIEEIESRGERTLDYPYYLGELNTDIPSQLCQNLVESIIGLESEFYIVNCEDFYLALKIDNLELESLTYNFQLVQWETEYIYYFDHDCFDGME